MARIILASDGPHQVESRAISGFHGVMVRFASLPRLRSRIRRLSLPAKMTSVILVVLLSVFSLIPVAIHEFVKPLLLDETKRIGVASGTTLVDEIVDQRMMSEPSAEKVIEVRLRELLYLQPSIQRMEVYRVDPETGLNALISSSVEEAEIGPKRAIPLVKHVSSELIQNADEPGENGWEILIPIPPRSGSKKTIGTVRVVVSVNLVSRMVNLLTRVSIGAAFLGVILLTTLLSFALRRTIENDRKLRAAETENQVLSRQLQETEKQVMNLEKLAVMGQLTANFAHEIGTPLNAIGGHLTLLKDESPGSSRERIGIIEGQVRKITDVVKGFLQSTAKPPSQAQLVDPHRVMETALQIVRPRTDLLQVQIEKHFDREMGPIRMVPIELEQVLLNLVNNSLDSLKEKSQHDRTFAPELKLETHLTKAQGRPTLEILVRDNGEGISDAAIQQIFKPFYTTKAPGEGTGLGLSICRDILKRYRGDLQFRSKEGEWTEVTVRIPFRADAPGVGTS